MRLTPIWGKTASAVHAQAVQQFSSLGFVIAGLAQHPINHRLSWSGPVMVVSLLLAVCCLVGYAVLATLAA